MPGTHKTHSPSVLAKVAVEAIGGVKTAVEIAKAFDAHPNLAANGKRQALERPPPKIAGPHAARQDGEPGKDALYQQTGRLKAELDFLKKRAAGAIENQRRWVDPHHPALPIRRQSRLLRRCRGVLARTVSS